MLNATEPFYSCGIDASKLRTTRRLLGFGRCENVKSPQYTHIRYIEGNFYSFRRKTSEIML